MKIRADEHVAVRIVRAVREIALSSDWQLSHVVESGDRGLADEHWITRFAGEAGHAILTADTDFFRRHHQVLAIQRSGLKIIHLPSRSANARADLQAAHILLWWRRIEAKIVAMRPRACGRPPWNINEQGDLAQVKVEYERSRKRAYKAAKRRE